MLSKGTDVGAHAAEAEKRAASERVAHAVALADLAELRASLSWRVTRPLRAMRRLLRGQTRLAFMEAGVPPSRIEGLKRVAGGNGGVSKRTLRLAFYMASHLARRLPGTAMIAAHLERLAPRPWAWLRRHDAAYRAAARAADPAALPEAWAALRSGAWLRAVHQLHPGPPPDDAETDAMLRTRRWLHSQGFESEIFVERRDPALAHELLEIGDLPRHGDHVLILRHAMRGDARGITALSPRAILMSHPAPAVIVESAETGLPHAAPGDGAPFTILFAGQIAEQEGQADLVDAFAAFRRLWDRPCRLILLGHVPVPSAAYRAEILRRIALHGLQDEVLLTDLRPEAERQAWYRAADLYVSLSPQQGFGPLPMMQAAMQGIPVIAWPAGGPGTLAGIGEALPDRLPATAAAAMLRLAQDPRRRAATAEHQRQALAQFRRDHGATDLHAAMRSAGVAAPPDEAARCVLASSLRFAITGHVNGSYSLAGVNRVMARVLEAHRPGTVRLLPVEAEPTTDLSRVPAQYAAMMQALAARPAPMTGPELVISQHYPVHVPRDRADAAAALVAWEESLLPEATVDTLNAGFDAVFSMSRFVAKALIDSGVSRPVRTLGIALELDAFLQLGAERLAGPRERGGVFTFLHVSSCFPRKGVDVLMAAFVRAFRKEDPVRLVIKAFPNPHNDVAAQIDRLLRDDPGAPEILLIDRDLEAAALLDLYRQAHAAVLPTRGEGFNIPAAEAMAAGLPLIVTGFGGHLDFCTAAEARFVDYRFAASHSHVAPAGSVWAEPDQADLATALREVFDSAAGDRAARAHQAALARLDPAAWAERATRLAIDAFARPALPPLRLAWLSSWDLRCGIAEYSRFLVDRLAALGPAELASLTILADDRTPASLQGSRVQVRPAWRLQDGEGIDAMARAIATEDPHALVIQHQPGLMHWHDLSRLLADRRIRGRITLVALHATTRLHDIAEEERQTTLHALGQATRVLVHRIEDLNRLKSLGLTANVTLFPHGAPPACPAPAARPLTPQDAPVIGCFGFFLPGKGIPRLIEAAAALRRHWPALRLHLVNAAYPRVSEEEIARCRALADRLGLHDAITWDMEFHSQAACMPRLAACDLLVLPYDESKESASGALRIALASGVPVAVTPVALFEEAEAAVHRFERVDVPATAAGIDRLLRDQALRLRLQQAAPAWLAARSWDGLARRLHGMIAGLRASRCFPAD